MLDKLLPITKGLNRRFANGNEPFQIATRLLEECGELAKEINHFEGRGIKREKYGEPDKAHLAKEVQDVMRSALQIALYYQIEAELEASIDQSYRRMIAEGLISETMETRPKIPVNISPINEHNLALLEKNFAEGGAAKHGERFLRQQNREVVYLIAFHQGQPVGHALIKWNGSEDQYVTEKFHFSCPDIEDLFVLLEFRSQGIGAQLLDFAEEMAQKHGYTQIGLSVAAETNGRARRLYERRGYADAQFGEYLEQGEFVDVNGQHQVWEETCIYLIKNLI